MSGIFLTMWQTAGRSRAVRLPLALLGALSIVASGAGAVQAGLRVIAPPLRAATIVNVPPHRISRVVPDTSYVSPATGTTGTAALPPIPPTAHDDAGVSAIAPAAPFSTARAAGIDRARALECLTAAVYYEAAPEPDDGERAVAQVVLNRVRHPAFPNTVCGVVYQGSERSGCQFSFACDGAHARAPSRDGWARAARIAAAALGGYVFAPVGLATHYHTFAVTPAWNRALVMTDAIGAHFFHRWKGYWGTPRAFSQAYRGHEPPPQPTAPITAPLISPLVATPVSIAMPSTRDKTSPLPVRVGKIGDGEAMDGAAQSGDPLLPPPEILDRWKDSGKPLR